MALATDHAWSRGKEGGLMGWLDWLKKKPGAADERNALAQTCYEIAYFLLPAFLADEEKLRDIFVRNGDAAGAFFYVMACQRGKIEPVQEVAAAFRVHTGQIADGADYFLLDYPSPPPVNPDISKAVLAPYFSVVIFYGGTPKAAYYILGQNPFGGTTFRSVTPDGMNSNLGRGSEPDLNEFLRFLSHKMNIAESS
ncbi:MAG: hypothetical protein H8F28_21915 [Fibrella sp.]|nr:hypothetical protein [Armatimonadota bacterium]